MEEVMLYVRRTVENIASVAELPYHNSDSTLDYKRKAKKLLRKPLLRCRGASEKEGQETSWQNPCL
jgi:hypothetical protein